jgi:hypothetical protein
VQVRAGMSPSKHAGLTNTQFCVTIYAKTQHSKQRFEFEKKFSKKFQKKRTLFAKKAVYIGEGTKTSVSKPTVPYVNNRYQ